jgi:hypothetical protein
LPHLLRLILHIVLKLVHQVLQLGLTGTLLRAGRIQWEELHRKSVKY